MFLYAYVINIGDKTEMCYDGCGPSAVLQCAVVGPVQCCTIKFEPLRTKLPIFCSRSGFSVDVVTHAWE